MSDQPDDDADWQDAGVQEYARVWTRAADAYTANFQAAIDQYATTRAIALEAVAADDKRLAAVRSDLLLIKWMLGAVLAMLVSLLFKVFGG